MHRYPYYYDVETDSDEDEELIQDSPYNTGKLLILDLDGTLVYVVNSRETDEIKPEREPDFTFTDQEHLSDSDRSSENKVTTYYGWKRPGLDEFLSWCIQNVTLGFWTAATPSYAEEVLRAILPIGFTPFLVYTEPQCTFRAKGKKTLTVKRLKKIWGHTSRPKYGFRKEHILVVDDTPSTYMHNYGNALPIVSWYGDTDDTALYEIWQQVEECLPLRNVRQR